MRAASRKLHRALALIYLLAAGALFAPWIANDLPLYVRGGSRVLCRERLGLLWEAQRARDRSALQRGVERLLRESVAAGDALHERLERWSEKLRALPGGRAALDELCAEIELGLTPYRPDLVLEARRERLEELAPDLEEALEPLLRALLGPAHQRALTRALRGGGEVRTPPPREVRLRQRSWWPVLQSLGDVEFFFMALVVADLLLRALGWRRHRVRRWLLIAVVTALASAWHHAMVPPLAARPAFRAEMLAGGFEIAACVYPPLPFSYAGSHGEPPDLPPGGAMSSAPGKPAESYDPAAPAGSFGRHPLGTDSAGRDVFARLIWGGRISLGVGVLCAALVGILGTILGAAAGFFGGWLDVALQRLIEVLLCFPTLFLVIAVVAATYGAEGQEGLEAVPIWNVMVVIALVRWTHLARLVRAEVLRVRALDFVMAARSLGMRSARILVHHILPHALAPVWVALAFEVSAAMLIEAALSFLGFGIREPMASWGYVLRGAFEDASRWWIVVFPGVLILCAVFCYNLLGEALAELLDPRRRLGDGPC